MNEQRLNAYQTLMNNLLTCPSGEELQILQDNQELLDQNFLQFLLAISSQLQEAGKQQEAELLINLAEELSLFMGNTNSPEDYYKFLMGVLQAVLKSQGNPQIVYPLFQQNLDKLDENLANILKNRVTATLKELSLEAAIYMAAVIAEFGNLILQFPQGSRKNNLEISIATSQATLEIYTREAFPEQWAGTQNNLANAYKDRIKGEKAENIERAIRFYQAALEIINRVAFPEDWAMIQNNLANAYSNRIKGEKAQNIERAIAIYQAALEIRTREAFPKQWATTQNNLALAYYYRIKGGKAQNIERAIALYQAALEIYTREAFPEDWAMTQNNLAIAYSDRIKGEKAENIEQAITFYQAALEITTRAAFPEQWAQTQNNLAAAYYGRIKGEKAENIEQTIAFYQAALEIRTRAAFPYNYLGTSFNLGVVYQASQQWQLAYETFDNAIETLEEIRAGIVKGGDADKQKLAEEWQKLYQGMVEVCIELKNYTAAIEYVERSKTRNLVELLATRDLYPKGDIPQTVLDELDRLRRDIETEQRRLEIEERTRNPFGDGTTGERSPNIAALQTPPPDRNRLNQLRQELDTLITRDITPKDPDFLLTQKVEPMPFSDIQALTGDNTAILEWYILSDRFVVFIVTPPSSPSRTRDGGEVKLWQSTPEDYNALIAWAADYLAYYETDKKQWQNTLTSRLQRLGEILHFDQLLNAIGEKCDSLVLIPNRFLHLFPLHALPISQQKPTIAKGGVGGSILMDLFPGGVSYAPSCQLLQTAKNRQRRDFSQLFAIQNPTKDLAYTDLEVNSIRTYFNPSHILVHENAKKTTFNEQQTTLKTANCHHFSCHGYFNFENPILSALLFADCYLEPAPSPLDPSRHLRLEKGQTLDLSECLTLGDVFTLDLRCCRLVTLSACETGLIDFQSNSDEYIGLPSGFLVAGSTNVVSSLWSVSDISTAILMIRFYQLLREGEEVAIALNHAQNWLRNATKAELLAWIDPGNKMQLRQSLKKIEDHEKPFASSYYWAAFCAIGR
ncbi:MAG: CHAT domain-containing protein [Planktothrix rubescens PR222]